MADVTLELVLLNHATLLTVFEQNKIISLLSKETEETVKKKYGKVLADHTSGLFSAHGLTPKKTL